MVQLVLDPAWLVAFGLVALRLGALLIMTPVFASLRMPPSVRVWLILGIAGSVLSGLHISPSSIPLAWLPLTLAALAELSVGAMMAFGLFAAFAVFQVAGKLLDLQIGFSIGSVFDPATRGQMPLLGSMLNMLALAVFFSMDGHHLLYRGLAYSFERIPIGGGFTAWPFDAVVAQFGVMFVLGLMLVAPVVFVLLLMDVGLGLISRTMPQINIFVIGIPTKIVVGILMLWLSLRYLAPVMSRAFTTIFTYWQRLLG